MTNRLCRVCEVEKPRDDFYKNGQGGLYRTCKLCYNMRRHPAAAPRRAQRAALVAAELKRCYFCKQTKSFSEFHRRKRSADGRTDQCKPCMRHRYAQYYSANPERGAKYYAANKARMIAYNKRWIAANPGYGAKYYAANRARERAKYQRWAKANPDRISAIRGERRASELNATPPWVNKKTLTMIYGRSQILTRKTGIQHHVDHIVPLRHALVCGLHVPWNLQILTADENIRKNNLFKAA